MDRTDTCISCQHLYLSKAERVSIRVAQHYPEHLVPYECLITDASIEQSNWIDHSPEEEYNDLFTHTCGTFKSCIEE